MKITIIGAGAMGGLFATLLSVKNDITVVCADVSSESLLKKKGFAIRKADGSLLKAKKIRFISDYKKIDPSSLIIICVKAYDTRQVVKSLKSKITGSTYVMTLQNGLGNIELLSKICDKRHMISGVTLQSAFVVGAGLVRHTGNGKTFLCCEDATTIKEISKIFASCGIKCIPVKDIRSLVWSKLIVNCALNPVVAVAGVKNGDIIKHKDLMEVALIAGEEAKRIAAKLNIKILFNDVRRQIIKICSATSGNINSMLADLSRGKKTEISFLNGALVKEAEKLGIEIPVNKALYELVASLEKRCCVYDNRS